MASTTTASEVPKETPPSYPEAIASTNPELGSTNAVASETGDTVPIFAAPGLTDQTIRRRFIRKVYLILTAQLLVTVAFVAVFQFVKPVRDYVQTNLWLYISSM